MQNNYKQFNYREEPISLIGFDTQQNKYIVNDEAMQLINSVPQPMGIVAVAGMYRTGKSYLLNRMLLNRPDGFGVGPTVNACTKGLWIWGKPLIGQTADGETVNVLLIDSEGIGALDESHNHDNKVFALTILISSMFIYNSMGSIDENAVQNLSLVVNLTKNIQIKSNQRLNNNDDVDSEDYAQYFPSFFWVVRDFTLQLVDSKGEPMSSKEYLEKALALQKGFSDSVESKNRIRRLLTTFFKERDCVTLVRPLTNEENLQNLDKMDFGDLRPEFFEQIIHFRKKVLNRVRVKTLNNKQMSGEMMGSLINTYVQSINEGAVPNIENAWSYICKSQCYKAMQESLDAYDRALREGTLNKLPMGLDELKAFHQAAKKNSLLIFKRKAIGDTIEEFTEEFLQKLKAKFVKVKGDNEREGERACMNFINMEFMTIDRKLKNHEYQMYEEYERDIGLFQQYFKENGPQTVNKNEIILEFCQKMLAEGANYFVRNISREFEMQQQYNKAEQAKMQQEVNDTRAEIQNTKSSMMVKITQLESEKGEIENRENYMKEQMEEIIQEKQRQENYLKEEINQERGRAQKELSEIKQQLLQKDDNSKEVQRSLLMKESEFDKTLALYNQKVSYLEKANEELSKKDKEVSDQLKNNKRDYQAQMKDHLSKQEANGRAQQTKINSLNEKVLELENDLATKEHTFDMERKKWSLVESQLQQAHNEAHQAMNHMSAELKELKSNEEKYLELNNQSSKIREEELRQQVEALQMDLKQRSEALKATKIETDKDKAILQQKNEFLEMQMDSLQKQVAEKQKTYDNMIKAFQSNRKENNTGQLQEIKQKYQDEMHRMQEEWENNRKRLSKELEAMTEKYGDLELKYKCELNEQLKENEQLTERLQETLRENKQHQETIKQLDENKQQMVKEQETRYNYKIRQLEQQVDEYKKKLHGEQQEHEIRSEEQLSQLKSFYELEKERLEKKLHEQKQQHDKKLANLVNEYEEKMREDKFNFDDEMEILKDDNFVLEQQLADLERQKNHDLELKEQQLVNQEKYLKELKEQLAREQNNSQQVHDQVAQKFNLELKVLTEKLEAAQNELSKRDKSNLGLQHQQEQVQSQLQRKEEQYEKIKRELLEDKESLQQRLDEIREKYQHLSNEYMEKKMQFEKQIALLTQQQEFMNKKHQEAVESLKENQAKYEERIQYFEKDFVEQTEERIQKINEDKEAVQNKLDSYKKEQKDKDLQRSRQLALLEKDKAVVEEKLTNLEIKKNELQERLGQENVRLTQQIQELKVTLSSGSSEQTKIVNQLKDQLQELENSRQEMNSNYQRDLVLWQNKQKFLEQQNSQFKEELQQNKEQFELTLQHLTAKMDSENTEAFNDHINQVKEEQENKFKLRLRDVEDNYNKKQADNEDRIKRMDKEIKQLNDKLVLETQGKIGSLSQNEKKINDLVEKEQKYLSQIQALKNERDGKVVEYQEMLDKERGMLKEKIQQIEYKLQESEKKKSNMLFEHEKERTKWNTEKDIILSNKDQLQEDLTKAEKKKDQLLRENEKLRVDNRNSRKTVLMNNPMQRQSRIVGQSPSNAARGNFSIMQQLNEQNLNNSLVNDDNKSEQSFNEGSVYRQPQSNTFLGNTNISQDGRPGFEKTMTQSALHQTGPIYKPGESTFNFSNDYRKNNDQPPQQ